MAVSSVTSNTVIQLINQQQQQLQQLQVQLGSGRKAESYGGLGSQRQVALDAQAKLAAFDGFNQTISQLNVRLNVVQSTLDRFNKIINEQRGADTTTSFTPVDGQQTSQQKLALSELDEVIGLLNASSGGRKLFSGRATTSDASLTSADIINGANGKSGLADVITERNKADLGADGLGRLQQSQTGNAITLSETASGPFGFKISGIGGNLTNATATTAAGPPVSATVDFTGLPNPGDTFRITFNLPDGASVPLTLTATTSTTPANGEFRIGADAAATAANFNAVLNDQVTKLAAGDLKASSTLAAANGFFDVTNGPPAKTPTRVDISGGPPETATQLLTTGTDANTVTWYTGDAGAGSARQTSTVRIDTSITVGYGIRANEPGIRNLVAGLAAFAASNFNSSDPNVQLSYSSLSIGVRDQLGNTKGQTVSTISSEIAVVQQSAQSAQTRQTGTKTLLQNLVGDIETVDPQAIASQILDLQTKLQASYQVTSRLSQLSLVNFLN